jgi:hypothetical protein
MAHPFSVLATEIYNEVLRQANVEPLAAPPAAAPPGRSQPLADPLRHAAAMVGRHHRGCPEGKGEKRRWRREPPSHDPAATQEEPPLA